MNHPPSALRTPHSAIEGSAIRNPQSASGASAILVVDKPAGWTSHDVVARVRKLFGTRRVGHTGTLDPFATGVLVVCLNQATRLVQFLTSEEKEYVATVRFGFATDTGDLTGTPLSAPQRTEQLTSAQIEAALAPLRGRIQQVPPMYSAKKIAGVKLYELARRGETIERAPIDVEIKTLELLAHPQADVCTLRVVCSSGTYVRTLAEDIGIALGVGAHLTALRRTRAGQVTLEQAHTLEQLATLTAEGRNAKALIPMRAALALPGVIVTEDEQRALQHGRALLRPTRDGDASVMATSENDWAQLCATDGQVLAIAQRVGETWQPRVVLNV